MTTIISLSSNESFMVAEQYVLSVLLDGVSDSVANEVILPVEKINDCKNQPTTFLH